MYLVSNEEMRKLDHAAIDNWCIPSMILMENAGIEPSALPDVQVFWDSGCTIIYLAADKKTGGRFGSFRYRAAGKCNYDSGA